MPEYDIKKIQELYDIIERMGITREEKGVKYLAFMLYRICKDPDYTNIEQLYKSTATQFNRTVDRVKDGLTAVQVAVYKIMTSTKVLSNAEIKRTLDEYFHGDVTVINDSEKFLNCLREVVLN